MRYSTLLRPATFSDIEPLQALMRKSIRGLSDGFYSPIEAEAAVRFIASPDPDVIADGTFYVIESAGEIVACGGWSSRRKLFTGSSDQEGLSDERLDHRLDAARIRAFFIDPGYARQGLGTVLYLECERSALAAGFTAFELVATLPGVPFYARLGFVEVEPVAAKLPDGTTLPCVRMCRTIAQKVAPL